MGTGQSLGQLVLLNPAWRERKGRRAWRSGPGHLRGWSNPDRRQRVARRHNRRVHRGAERKAVRGLRHLLGRADRIGGHRRRRGQPRTGCQERERNGKDEKSRARHRRHSSLGVASHGSLWCGCNDQYWSDYAHASLSHASDGAGVQPTRTCRIPFFRQLSKRGRSRLRRGLHSGCGRRPGQGRRERRVCPRHRSHLTVCSKPHAKRRAG